jgi:hypothetical protein
MSITTINNERDERANMIFLLLCVEVYRQRIDLIGERRGAIATLYWLDAARLNLFRVDRLHFPNIECLGKATMRGRVLVEIENAPIPSRNRGAVYLFANLSID